jgi:hypothetical protein
MLLSGQLKWFIWHGHHPVCPHESRQTMNRKDKIIRISSLMAQKQGPPYESCFFVRASAGRAIPVASDIKIISLCFI